MNQDLKAVNHSALVALYRASIAMKAMHGKEGLEEYETHYKERAEQYEAEILRRLKWLDRLQEELT